MIRGREVHSGPEALSVRSGQPDRAVRCGRHVCGLFGDREGHQFAHEAAGHTGDRVVLDAQPVAATAAAPAAAVVMAAARRGGERRRVGRRRRLRVRVRAVRLNGRLCVHDTGHRAAGAEAGALLAVRLSEPDRRAAAAVLQAETRAPAAPNARAQRRRPRRQRRPLDHNVLDHFRRLKVCPVASLLQPLFEARDRR